MKYAKRFEIHDIPQELWIHVQRGQWVTVSGSPARWCGVRKRSGVAVAAYQPAGDTKIKRLKQLYEYARG